MAKAGSVVIVIDCSIAHAAGPETARHPTSKHCRDFLLAILRICHRIGLSDAVADEWKRHRSGFARQWLVSMYARKKVVRIDAPADSALRDTISEFAASEITRDAMLKDAHLVETATNSDRRVASLDDTVRRLFGEIATHSSEIRSIYWVNPDTEFEEVIEWLEAQAPLTANRLLGNVLP
ncbi:MAG: hypothetical protein JWP89_3471 [Schlesneria sp.]|nr:hypothetical protein [Schlesneria sp.]